MSGISIQIIQPRSARAAGELISRILHEEFDAVVSACSDRDLDDMYAAYTGHGRMCRVAIAGEQVIGVAAARETPAGALELTRLYVAREHRGTGLATALLDTVHRWAAAQGYQQTILTTTGLMTCARRFYENAGYREYESETIGSAKLHRYRRTGTVRPVGDRIALGTAPACTDGDLPVVLERVRGSVEGWNYDRESGDLVLVEHYPIPVPVNYGYTPIWENPADGDFLDTIVMDDRLMRPG